MNREEIQAEALKATEGKHKCCVVLGTGVGKTLVCLLYTSPSPRDRQRSRMPSSA